jgi:hypothetical protein
LFSAAELIIKITAVASLPRTFMGGALRAPPINVSVLTALTVARLAFKEIPAIFSKAAGIFRLYF